MVTRKDVAERAGVSVTAVSRVVNNSGYVARDKREAILQAVRELGYQPKSITIASRWTDTRQILFLNKNFGNSTTIDMYRGMTDYAWKYGYMVSLCGTWEIENIKSMSVGGVILSDEGSTEAFDVTFHGLLPLPTVSASFGIARSQPRHIPFVEMDTYEAMEMLLEYLFARGHRRIAFASPHPVEEINSRGIAYYNNMRPILQDMIKNYLLVEDNHPRIGISEEADFAQIGKSLAGKFVERKLDATAIACFNDDIALGMIFRFQEMGIRVPEDISVMSIGGLEKSRSIYPGLSAVLLSPYNQGRECARVLLHVIHHKSVHRRTRLKVGPVFPGTSVKSLNGE